MAKNKSAAGGKASNRGTSSARGAARQSAKTESRGRGLGKGGVLEVGNARRDAGAAAGNMPRAATKRTARKTPLQLPGEKAVRRTSRTVPVEPEHAAPGDRERLPDAAVDRRRQVIGTDDKGGQGRR